jgi:cytochrome P450
LQPRRPRPRSAGESHWTFGHGIHFCLGNAVARLETRVALEVLLECAPDYAVDSKGIVRNQLVPTRGVAHAPLAFGPISPAYPAAASSARKN